MTSLTEARWALNELIDAAPPRAEAHLEVVQKTLDLIDLDELEDAFFLITCLRPDPDQTALMLNDALLSYLATALRDKKDNLLATAAFQESNAKGAGAAYIDLLDLSLELEPEDFRAAFQARTLAYLEAYHRKNPDDIDAAEQLARAYYEQKDEDIDAAKRTATAALERHPERVTLQHFLISFIEEEDFDRAQSMRRAAVERAEDIDALHPSDLEVLSDMALFIGDLSSSRRFLAEAAARESVPWLARSYQAVLETFDLLDDERWVDAAIWYLCIFDNLDEISPHEEGFLFFVADQLEKNNEPFLALVLLEESIASIEVTQRRERLRDATEVDEDQYDLIKEAIEDISARLRQRVLDEPKEAWAWYALAHALYSDEQHDDALHAIKKALMIDRDALDHHVILVKILCAMSDKDALTLDVAMEAIETALVSHQDAASLLLLKAEHHPDAELALEATKRLLTRDPLDEDLLKLEREKLIRLKRWDALEAHLWHMADVLSGEDEVVATIDQMIAYLNQDHSNDIDVLLTLAEERDEDEEEEEEEEALEPDWIEMPNQPPVSLTRSPPQPATPKGADWPRRVRWLVVIALIALWLLSDK